MHKVTVEAPSNLAFTKYWGKKEPEDLRLPTNGSISVCLDDMSTVTTAEFDENLEDDVVIIGGEQLEGNKFEKTVKHLNRVRAIAGIDTKMRVESNNSFPSGTGLSSSASGFAALSMAASLAAGLELSERELSILARQGSGSATRSIPSGFVEWLDGDSSDSSYAETIFNADHWDLSLIVGVVSEKPKHVPTSAGQQGARTSPFFDDRVERMAEKNQRIKKLIKTKDFSNFGTLLERDALELHAIMLTQEQPLIYWSPGTIELMRWVMSQRQDSDGIEAYFSVNTGQDIYFVTERKNENAFKEVLKATGIVRDVIINHPGKGAREIHEHLF